MEPIINNQVININQQENLVQESFFDRNITWIVLFVNSLQLILNTVLGFFIGISGPNSATASPFVQYSGILTFVIPFLSLLLGIFNFRGKRKGILIGLAYYVIVYILLTVLLFSAFITILQGSSGH